MSDNPSLTIPRDVIEPIIQAHVTTAVMTALGDKEQIISRCVRQIMEQKVDRAGKPSTYNSSSDLSWLQWVMQDCVTNALRAAIVETLETQKAQIKKQLAEELSRKNSPLIRQLVAGMVGAMTHPDVLRYNISVAYDERTS